MNKCKSPVVFILVILLIFAAPTQDDIDSKKSDLQLIRDEIETFKKSVSQKAIEEKKIIQKINRVDKEIVLTSKILRALMRENQNLEEEIANKTESIAEKELQFADLKKRLDDRLRKMYITGKTGLLEAFLDRTSSISIVSKLKYLQSLAEYDARLAKQVLSAQEKLIARREELVILQKEKEMLLNETSQNKKSLESQKSKKKSLLTKVKIDKKSFQEIIAQKEEEEKSYIKLIQELERLKQEAEQSREAGKITFIPDVPFGTLKGKLPWPTVGRIIQKFGPIANKTHKTYTEHLGVDIKASHGKFVKCVGDGQIVIVTYMRRFGNMVMVDHGGSFYTIYGHLDEVFVAKGMILKAGENIGTVGETGSLVGTKVYFAIWENGKHTNPETWFN